MMLGDVFSEAFFYLPWVALVGVAIALWGYPWRRPALRPYVWFVLALLAPLLAILGLQALFTVQAGAVTHRPLNYAPALLALVPLLIGIALVARCKGYRRFVSGAALAICSLTIFWSFVAVMSLSGDWI